MSTEQTAPSLPDPDYASPEWQEWCAQHFVPLEPGAGAEPERAGPDVIDFDELETAQEQYCEVLTLLRETLPFKEWLKWRPAFVKPEQYDIWVETLQGMARELEESFDVALLTAGPAISTQRRRPH